MEGIVLGQVLVVPEAHEALGIAHELVGEGQPHRPVEGVEDQPQHQDEEREEEEGGGAEVAIPLAAAPAAARRGSAQGERSRVPRHARRVS